MYGFTVNCDGNAVEQLRLIESALGSAGVKAKVEVGEIENSFAGMGEKITGIFGNLKSIIAGSIIGGGVFGGYEFVKSSKEAYDELQKSIVRVSTVLNSTHHAAGFSNLAIVDQAKQLSDHIVNSQAQVLDAQGMQLSFTNIKGPQFKESMAAIADFATFYKEDMTSAALQVDKAVNDPVLGFRRLMREGVTFTAEQEKQIKNYEKQGNLAKAQEVILKELNKEFGGQASAFALTDQGKIEMDAKQWEEVKVEIGGVISKIQLELLPLFKEVRDYTKEAFDSGPMQFFITHLKDILTLGFKIIPMWVIYKGTVTSLSLVTSAYTAVQGLLGTTIAETTAATEIQKVTVTGFMTVQQEAIGVTEEATVATQAFGAAWSSIGIGAFAVGLGLLVEQIISFNKEFNESIENMDHLKQMQGIVNPILKSGSDTWSSYNHDKGLSKDQKSELLLNAINNRKSAEDALAISVAPDIDETKKKIASITTDSKRIQNIYKSNGLLGLSSDKAGALQDRDNTNSAQLKKLTEHLSTLQNLPGYLTGIIKQSQTLINDYTKQGIKQLGYTPIGKATDHSAYATSELAGAKGGLGEAKVINVHIDTVQKNIGVTGSGVENNADKAIQFLIRAINNMAMPQSSTF